MLEFILVMLLLLVFINLNIKSTNFGDYDIPLSRDYEKSLDAILINVK